MAQPAKANGTVRWVGLALVFIGAEMVLLGFLLWHNTLLAVAGIGIEVLGISISNMAVSTQRDTARLP